MAELQTRLRSFLKQSSQYDSRLVLARIRGSPLWQEQVILHSKVSHASPFWHVSKPDRTLTHSFSKEDLGTRERLMLCWHCQN